MKFESEARILTAETNKYNIEGSEVVSHRIRVSVEGEIYPCKSDESQVAFMKKYEGKDGTAIIKVNSRKENVSCQLIAFQPE